MSAILKISKQASMTNICQGPMQKLISQKLSMVIKRWQSKKIEFSQIQETKECKQVISTYRHLPEEAGSNDLIYTADIKALFEKKHQDGNPLEMNFNKKSFFEKKKFQEWLMKLSENK